MWEDSTNKKREKKKGTGGFVCNGFPGLSCLGCCAKQHLHGFGGFFFVTSVMLKISIYYQHIYFFVHPCCHLHMLVRGNKEIPIHGFCNKAVKKALKRTEYGPLLLE